MRFFFFSPSLQVSSTSTSSRRPPPPSTSLPSFPSFPPPLFFFPPAMKRLTSNLKEIDENYLSTWGVAPTRGLKQKRGGGEEVETALPGATLPSFPPPFFCACGMIQEELPPVSTKRQGRADSKERKKRWGGRRKGTNEEAKERTKKERMEEAEKTRL